MEDVCAGTACKEPTDTLLRCIQTCPPYARLHLLLGGQKRLLRSLESIDDCRFRTIQCFGSEIRTS